MFSALLPKGAPFFELLLQQNHILCTVAAALTAILEDHTYMNDQHREITLLEEEADTLYLAVTRHLSQTFITPIDREDILHINKAHEESIDQIYHLANRMYIFEFPYIRFPMLELSRKLTGMARLTGSMLAGLSRKKDSHNTKEFRALRGDSEMLLSVGLAELYDLAEPNTKDVLEVIKWTQAYDRMERALEEVIELAEAIEEAVLKNV